MKRILEIFAIMWMWLGMAAAQTQQLTVIWDPNTEPDVTRYRVQRAVNGGGFSDFQEMQHPQAAVQDGSVAPGNRYQYRVAAIDTGGLQSNWSNVAVAGIPQISLSLSELSNTGVISLALADFLSDPDGSVAALDLLVSQPINVSVSVANGALQLTPPASYTGPASFRLRATDADGFFDEREITFTFVQGNAPTTVIVQVPDPRFAEDTSFQIWMDSCVTLNNFQPADLSWQFSGGANLTLNYDAAGRRLTIQPAPDWNGQSSFTATATAPDNASGSDNVTATLTPVNDPPVINVSQLNLTSDPNQNVIDMKQHATDVDDTPADLRWEFSGFSQFTFEWVDPVNDILRITPPAGGGSETGIFRVRDVAGATTAAQVSLTAPGVSNTTITITIPPLAFNEDDSLILKLDDHVTVSNYTPADLLWSFSGGSNLRYTFRALDRSLKIESQAANWFGQDAFQTSATAPDQSSAAVTVQVTIAAVNDAPVLNLSELNIPNLNQNVFDLKLFADDVDNPAGALEWQFSGFSQFSFEWEDLAGRRIRITPLAGAAIETGTFTVRDPQGAQDAGQVTLYYSEDNTPPHLLFPAAIQMAEDSAIAFDLHGYVVDSTHVFSELSWRFDPGETITVQYDKNSGILRLQPVPDWSGETVLGVAVSDPFGAGDEAQVTVVVEERNGIFNLSVEEPAPGEVRIRFDCEMPSSAVLRYWRLPATVQQLSQPARRNEHSFLLTDLLPLQWYHFEISLLDANNRRFGYLDSLKTGAFRREEESQDAPELLVYPNPIKTAKGHQAMIFRNLPETVRRVEIFSLAGQKVFESEIIANAEAEFKVDMLSNSSAMPSGIYVYLVKDEDSKIIKQDRIVVIR